MKPEVSIITTVYNKEAVLLNNVLPSLNQKKIDFELVLVDDKSPDNCPKLCDDIATNYKNVRVIHCEKNGGHVLAYNIGIENARGDYVVLVDADDYLLDENCILNMLNLAHSHNADCVRPDFLGGDYNNIKDDSMTGESLLFELLKSKKYHPTTRGILFKKDIFKNNPLKNYICDDEEWTMRTLLGLKKVVLFREKIYQRVAAPDSVTQTISQFNYFRKSRDRLFASRDLKQFFDQNKTSKRETKLIYTRILNLYMMAINIRLRHITDHEYETQIDELIKKTSMVLNDSNKVGFKYVLFTIVYKVFGLKASLKVYSMFGHK